MTFTEFLIWAATGPGSLVIAGFLSAYVLERFTFWHKVNHDLKALSVIVLAIAVSYGAKEANVEVVTSNELLNQIFTVFVYYASTQLGYKKYFDNGLLTNVKKA